MNYGSNFKHNSRLCVGKIHLEVSIVSAHTIEADKRKSSLVATTFERCLPCSNVQAEKMYYFLKKLIIFAR